MVQETLLAAVAMRTVIENHSSREGLDSMLGLICREIFIQLTLIFRMHCLAVSIKVFMQPVPRIFYSGV